MKSKEFGKFGISELVHAIWVEIKAYLQIAYQIKSNHIYWYMAALRLDHTITQSRRTQSHKVGYCH